MPSQECVVLLYFLLNQFPNSRIASLKTPKANPVRPGLSIALHWSLRLHHHDTVLLNGYLKSAAGTARLFHILMSEWDRLRSTNTDATKGQHHCLFPRALASVLPCPSPPTDTVATLQVTALSKLRSSQALLHFHRQDTNNPSPALN